jgi:hypothetical protein
MIGKYRIYPAWFDNGLRGQSDYLVAMDELALREAARLDRIVRHIEVVASGTDERGAWVNFDVTYSSSEGGIYERPRPANY